jgi:hypothetical protein
MESVIVTVTTRPIIQDNAFWGKFRIAKTIKNKYKGIHVSGCLTIGSKKSKKEFDSV